MLTGHETPRDLDLEGVLLHLEPQLQQRLRALDLDIDDGLLEIVLDVELGLRPRAPELEVALEVVALGPVAVTPEEIARVAFERRRAAAVISPAPALDDEWFGRYDENDPTTHPGDVAASKGALQRLVRWVRRGKA